MNRINQLKAYLKEVYEAFTFKPSIEYYNSLKCPLERKLYDDKIDDYCQILIGFSVYVNLISIAISLIAITIASIVLLTR